MAKPSPVAQAFHETWRRDFLPLLTLAGFASATRERVKPATITELVRRPLAAGERLEAWLWCDGGTGHSLQLRIDRVEPREGTEIFHDIELLVPWATDRPASLRFAAKELLPEQGLDRLTLA